MICETCMFGCKDSCRFYYNENTTNLLCIFKLPKEIVHYITKYLYHYNGHNVIYSNTKKWVCTACFQLGYYKTIHTKKINYFDSWIDDYYSKEVIEYFNKKYIPSSYNICNSPNSSI